MVNTNDTNYDVIIVGARIAGAATAAALAQQGARVLLLEQATFPATTISCPILFGNSLAALARLGLLDTVETLGAPRIRYYGTRTPDVDLVAWLPATEGYDYAYSLRREVLDEAIARRVAQLPGVTLRENFSVTDVVWRAGHVVGVQGRQGGGIEEQIYARAVVGADGKRSRVARAVRARVYDRLSGASCFFYAYYRGMTPLAEPSAVIYGDPQRQHGALVVDADDGLTVISAGLPTAEFDQARKDAAGTLEATWRSFPELVERCRNAERATPVMGQAAVDSFYRRSYGPGWALVGDAGHYIDPSTGQGINNALHSAELFAEAWARTQRGWRWEIALAAYQSKRDAATRPIYNLVSVGARLQQVASRNINLGKPLFRAIAREPEVASRYVGIFSGATGVSTFFNPFNIARILIEDGIYHELPNRAAQALGWTTS